MTGGNHQFETVPEMFNQVNKHMTSADINLLDGIGTADSVELLHFYIIAAITSKLNKGKGLILIAAVEKSG